MPNQSEDKRLSPAEQEQQTPNEHESKLSGENKPKKRKLLSRREYLRRRLLLDNKYYDNID